MGNEAALKIYQEKLEKQEISYNLLIDSLDDRLVALQEEINEIKKIASNYDGYDFEDDIMEIVRDMT